MEGIPSVLLELNCPGGGGNVGNPLRFDWMDSRSLSLLLCLLQEVFMVFFRLDQFPANGIMRRESKGIKKRRKECGGTFQASSQWLAT